MRFLGWHLEKFTSTVTEKSRSPLREESPQEKIEMDNALLIFASIEKEDEGKEEKVVSKTLELIKEHAKNLGVKNIVIHSFAHLFSQPASPETALKVLEELTTRLRESGFKVARTPFGWFNALEIKAKGHPLSRIAREIRF